LATSKRLAQQEGFTLLEVIIAVAIMVLAFASIIAVESNSISATTRAKEMNMVAMLARNQMVDLEYKIEGKTFDEVKKEDGGTFEAPYEKFRWKTTVKEIKFPSLGGGGGDAKGGTASGSGGAAAGGDPNAAYAEQITKMVTDYFTKAVREISVTIYWKRGSGEVNFNLSTYWVDLNHEFNPSP
jgi:general secretion pathway protein I